MALCRLALSATVVVFASLLAACGREEAGTTESAAPVAQGTGSAPPAGAAVPAPAASPGATTDPGVAAAAPGTTPQGQGTNPTSDGTPAPSVNPNAAPGTPQPGAQAGSVQPVSMPGMAVYAQACVACHGAGVAGAPKLGDKADWGPRIQQGEQVLYQHSIQGYQGQKGVMPPKGGFANLTDEQVRQAVDYMVAQGR